MADVHERTFLAIKPDAVQRGLIGTIIQRFEQRGYKLVGLKFMHASRPHLEVSSQIGFGVRRFTFIAVTFADLNSTLN